MMLNSIIFRNQERIDFYQEVEDLLDVEIAIETAYKEIADGHKNIGPFGNSKSETIQHWLRDLKQGSVSSMKEYVSEGEFLVLSSLPNSTNASQVFREARKLATNMGNISTAIMVHLLLPLINISLFLAVSYYSGAELIPAFTKIIPLDEWPIFSFITASFCLFVYGNIEYVLLSLFLLALITKFCLSNWSGKGRTIADNYFPFSIYKINSGTGFLLGLSSLMMSSAGRDNTATLRNLAKGSSPYTKSRILAIVKKMETGINIGDAMSLTQHDFPNKNVIRRIKLISGRDGFPVRLSKVAESWSNQSVETVRRKMSFLGHTVLFMTIGLIISLVFGITGILEKF